MSGKKYTLPDRRLVRDLAISGPGRVYVVSNNTFGVVNIGAEDHEFISFVPYIDTQFRDFNSVMRCHAVSEGAYFITDKYIFLVLNNGKILTWTTYTNFNKSFLLDGQLFVFTAKSGAIPD